MTPIVLATDPGSKHAGLVTRQADELLEYMLLVRHPNTTLSEWVHLVGQTSVDMYRAVSKPTGEQHIIVACEAVVAPTPHMGTIAVRGLLETAHVVGGLLRYWRDLILVPPNAHGTAPLKCYPKPLVGPREAKGHGALQHVRASWDVAFAAAVMVRTGAA